MRVGTDIPLQHSSALTEECICMHDRLNLVMQQQVTCSIARPGLAETDFPQHCLGSSDLLQTDFPAGMQIGQGKPVPPAEARSHTDLETFEGCLADLKWESGVPLYGNQAELPLGISTGAIGGASSGSMISSPKSKHSSSKIASMPSGLVISQR